MKSNKTYISANSQIIAQHDGNSSDPRYFYLHDRLGSVREIINTSGSVVKHYTYEPFGQTIEESSDGSLATSDGFMFSGQFFDDEIGQYYLRARQYSPYLSRFISRDLIDGKFEEPLTLHKYLYCQNGPINRFDLNGRWTMEIHRRFGRLGSGQAPDPFDYARLDIDYPAWKIDLDPTEYTWLHFMSREEIFPVLFGSSQNGDSYWFEYMMHAWQDSYVHYDAGYRAPWGHARDGTGPDRLDWPWNVEHNSYNRADITTRIFEDIWIKNNMDTAIEEGWLPDDFDPSSPWLSMGPRIYICGDDNEMVDIVDF